MLNSIWKMKEVLEGLKEMDLESKETQLGLDYLSLLLANLDTEIPDTIQACIEDILPDLVTGMIEVGLEGASEYSIEQTKTFLKNN